MRFGFISIGLMWVLLLTACPFGRSSFEDYFGLPLPADAQLFVTNGFELDKPRFEMRLPAKSFEAFKALAESNGYSPWETHLYDPREPLTMMERFIQGYGPGDAVFLQTTKIHQKTRKTIFYDVRTEVLVAIYYNN